MKATYSVRRVTYQEDRTTVLLAMGVVSDHHLGEDATLVLTGCKQLDLQPGNLVVMNVEVVPADSFASWPDPAKKFPGVQEVAQSPGPQHPDGCPCAWCQAGKPALGV